MKALALCSKALALLAAIAACLLWIDHLRAKPDARAFDAAGMARMESAMWRSYYEGKWVQLGWQAMRVARTQYGFSVLDSLRLAKHSAVAALRFRKSTDDPKCLPELEAYYAIVQKSAPARFDPATAAQLELEWWKQRRHGVPPTDYSRTIAQLAALVYGAPTDQMLAPSHLRASAMEYRDVRRNRPVSDDEWRTIEEMLAAAYGSLKAAILRGMPARERASPRVGHAGKRLCSSHQSLQSLRFDSMNLLTASFAVTSTIPCRASASDLAEPRIP